jgi:hypothetical protein
MDNTQQPLSPLAILLMKHLVDLARLKNVHDNDTTDGNISMNAVFAAHDIVFDVLAKARLLTTGTWIRKLTEIDVHKERRSRIATYIKLVEEEEVKAREEGSEEARGSDKVEGSRHSEKVQDWLKDVKSD